MTGKREQRCISLLPHETRTKLRSTQIVTSLPQIVSELVQNSLDANAKHIDVSINCSEWTCTVHDDGHGLSKNGMEILAKGGEEGRYCVLLCCSQLEEAFPDTP